MKPLFSHTWVHMNKHFTTTTTNETNIYSWFKAPVFGRSPEYCPNALMKSNNHYCAGQLLLCYTYVYLKRDKPLWAAYQITLLWRSHTILSLQRLYTLDLFNQQSAVMAYQLRPDRSNMLRVGSYKFHMEDVELIFNLYTIDQWSLYAIKESKFENATIQQIAVAVKHGKMDVEKIPYFQRPTMSYDPDFIVLSEFNVGHPTQ